MYQSVEQFTDKAYIVALRNCCISTLGDRNLFGSTANIKTVTKHLKGNQKFDPQKSVNTRTAKVPPQGHTRVIQMPACSCSAGEADTGSLQHTRLRRQPLRQGQLGTTAIQRVS